MSNLSEYNELLEEKKQELDSEWLEDDGEKKNKTGGRT